MQPGEIYMADFGPAVLHKPNGRGWAANGERKRSALHLMSEYVIMPQHISAGGNPMPTTPQHLPPSLDNQETSPEEKSQAIRMVPSVARRPIWEVIVKLGEQISDEEWANVPSDASINYKHYLYGTPTKNR